MNIRAVLNKYEGGSNVIYSIELIKGEGMRK